MLYDITHVTRYTYSAPVGLEPLILKLRPRCDANQTVRRYSLVVIPAPAGISHCVDLDGTTSETIWFNGLHDNLSIEIAMLVETHPDDPFNFLVTDTAALTLPFNYEAQLQSALAPYLLRANPSLKVDEFANEIMQKTKSETIAFLMLLAEQIPTRLKYMLREHGEPWLPEETLQHGEGACRDFSVLFMDVCRSVGIAARFVSGYCLGKESDHSHMHAWVEVYLPGAGWRGFDPSRGVTTSADHISVAAGRTPQDAAPSVGSFRGNAKSNMIADISVELPVN